MLMRLGRAALIGSALAVGACGYDCEDFCNDAADCPGSEQNPDQCDTDCEQIDDLNQASSCDDEWDDLMSCVGDVDDVCNDNDVKACQDEAETYVTCALSWCTKHPSASECN